MEPSKIEVQPLLDRHLRRAVDLHFEQLSDEFITRFGRRFLSAYYRAFAQSPYGVALVALDTRSGRVVGALLGTAGANQHYHYVLRHFGTRLGFLILLRAIVNPRLARDLFRTRVRRYLTGVYRQVLNRMRRKMTPCGEVEPVGDLTHLVVDTAFRSQGIGTQLVETYEALAWRAKVSRIDLVTSPKYLGGAGDFYEGLGFVCVGNHVSKSGEPFLLYRKHRVKQEKPAVVESSQ